MPRRAERLLPAAYALLGLLADGPAHGYDLHRAFEPGAGLAGVYRLEINQLYALLKQLAGRGLAEESNILPAGPAPPRRYFMITGAGREALARWLREPVRHTREIRLELLVKLYFAGREGQGGVRTLLAAQAEVTRETLGRLNAQWAQVAALPASDYRRLVLDLRLRQSRAVLSWLEDSMSAAAA